MNALQKYHLTAKYTISHQINSFKAKAQLQVTVICSVIKNLEFIIKILVTKKCSIFDKTIDFKEKLKYTSYLFANYESHLFVQTSIITVCKKSVRKCKNLIELFYLQLSKAFNV